MAIRGYLEDIKSQIYEELRQYPQPIAGCDLQYQHISEERDRISRELGRLDDVCRESFTRRDYIKAIDEFIRSSTYIQDEAEQKIRADLKKEFPDLNIFGSSAAQMRS